MMVLNKLNLFIYAIISGCTCLSATEFSPWFGPVLEIEGRVNCLVEQYSAIDGRVRSPYGYFPVDEHHVKDIQSACNVFVDVSASLAPTEEWSAEIEAVAADTRHRSFGMDSLLLTGRYRWLNDIVGDPVSLSTGLTVIKVFKPAWHDLAVFHHGGIACEAHVAAGKEFSCRQFWTNRVWAVAAAGVGDIGSPWLRGDLFWEHNWWDRQQVRLFVHSLWGMGGDTLNLAVPFRGYGPIRHQSVDAGLRYSYYFESGFTASVVYARRVFAKNCPQRVNFAIFELRYAFGL